MSPRMKLLTSLVEGWKMAGKLSQAAGATAKEQ